MTEPPGRVYGGLIDLLRPPAHGIDASVSIFAPSGAGTGFSEPRGVADRVVGEDRGDHDRVAVLPQSSVDGHSSRLGAAARSRALRSAERSVTWASDRNGDPALLVALADVYVSLDDLLQRIAAVDDGLHVPRFDQVREHGETP